MPVTGVKLIRCSHPTLPMPVIYEPTLCLVAQGRKQAMLGQSAFIYDKSRYLIASVDLPVMGSVIEASAEEPYLCMQLDLDTVELAELAIRYPSKSPGKSRPPAGLLLNETNPGCSMRRHACWAFWIRLTILMRLRRWRFGKYSIGC